MERMNNHGGTVSADVWYDQHNMGSGRLGPTIERELRNRPVFVVILSPAALTSQWVEDETRWAYGLQRKDPTRIILPITAATIAEDDIWLFLRDFKRIEAANFARIQQTRRQAICCALWRLPPLARRPTPSLRRQARMRTMR